MNRLARTALCCLAPFLLNSCGGDVGGPDDGGGTPSCDMEIISVAPSQPGTGDNVVVMARIEKINAAGIEVFEWAVDLDGVPVTFSPDNNPDAREISFSAAAAGVYNVTLTGSAGPVTCTDAAETVNVGAVNANVRTFRLRIIPAASTPAPAQERMLAIRGGADYALGTLSLDPGVMAGGAVTGPGGAPVAAYLRATDPTTGQIASEGFAGSDGGFQMRLPYGSFELFVAPSDGAIAPSRSMTAAASLHDLSIAAGDPFTGTVASSGGAPIAGARVALSLGSLPSTVGETAAGGSFAVTGRAGADTGLTVVPPAGSGLATLSIAGGPALSPGSAVAVSYAAHGSRTIDLDVVRADGTSPAAGAWVTLIARAIPAAGTITFPGNVQVAAAGSHRVTARANAAGALASLAVPDAIYDVLVESDAGATWRVLDLQAGQPTPTEVIEAVAAGLESQVLGADGAPVAGARVTARARGSAIALPPTFPPAGAVTRSDGRFELAVAPGLEYDIAIDPPVGTRIARGWRSAVAPAEGQSAALESIQLERAIEITGRVTVPGLAGGAAGARVELYCIGATIDCQGAAALAPIADAITGPSGSFALSVPDPGVGH